MQILDEKKLSKEDIEKMSRIFHVLADCNRLRIVMALMQRELCVNQLTQACGATQSNVSHQLRILRDNNVVRAKRSGQSTEYALADEHIREIVALAKAHMFCKAGDSEA